MSKNFSGSYFSHKRSRKAMKMFLFEPEKNILGVLVKIFLQLPGLFFIIQYFKYLYFSF